LLERARDVLGPDRISDESGSGVGAQKSPRPRVESTGRRQRARFLKTGDRLLDVSSEGAVDLAGREAGAVEQHLGAEHRGSS
jgi:hypothetical protein